MAWFHRALMALIVVLLSACSGRVYDGPRLGGSVPAVSYGSASQVFVDLVRQAGAFGAPDTPWTNPVPVGQDGWPTQDFGLMLMADQDLTPGLGGRYQIVFRGQADVSLVASPAGTLGEPRIDEETGLTLIDLDFAEGGKQLALAFKNTQGGVKDLQVIRPGHDWRNPPVFTQAFLDHVAHLGVLRTQEWTLPVSLNAATPWEARPTPITARTAGQSSLGLPWEYTIALANATGKDLWVNVPADMDAAYAQGVAALLKSGLTGTGKVYIEIGHENWNLALPAFRRLRDEARASLGLPSNAAGVDVEAEVRRLLFNRQLVLNDALKAAFGPEAFLSRVRPVLGVALTQSSWTPAMLQLAKAQGQEPGQVWYALAQGVFVNLMGQKTSTSLSSVDVLGLLEQSAAQLPVALQYENQLVMARKAGLAWFAYDGGIDTYGSPSLNAKIQAQRDPALQGICESMLRGWSIAGGDLFMWYHVGAQAMTSQYNLWGVSERLNDLEAPKFKCLKNIAAEALPQRQSRHVLPGSFSAAEAVPSSMSPAAVVFLSGGTERDYVINAPSAGCYLLSVQTQVSAGSTSPRTAGLQALIDGQPQGSSASHTLAEGASQEVVTLPLGQVCLSAGLHALTLKAAPAPAASLFLQQVDWVTAPQ
jgi:hypothetical protein